MTDEPDESMVCATYTHARRHPMVLGQIGGWTPPFQLTVTQVVVVVITFVIEVRTWPLWGSHLPRLAALVLLVAVPCTLGWVVRRTRMEGRSLPRVGLGWLLLFAMPRGGRVGGRAYRATRPGSPFRSAIFVAAGEAGERAR
jgi:hypothetical protein